MSNVFLYWDVTYIIDNIWCFIFYWLSVLTLRLLKSTRFLAKQLNVILFLKFTAPVMFTLILGIFSCLNILYNSVCSHKLKKEELINQTYRPVWYRLLCFHLNSHSWLLFFWSSRNNWYFKFSRDSSQINWRELKPVFNMTVTEVGSLGSCFSKPVFENR